MTKEIKIFNTPEILSRHLSDELQSSINNSNGDYYLAVSGGSTPLVMFNTLAEPYYKDNLKWDKVHFFWCDERCVNQDDYESNYGSAKKNLFDRINIPNANIHYIVETLGLFKRTIGEVTDIVEKEMYAFEDRNGAWLALRPEGTAGCVRAGIEHGILYNQQQKLWYAGPMFRHERPQKGRCRQFHQFGLEAFGYAGPDIDLDLILFAARLWRELGIQDHLQLQINSLGSAAARLLYRQRLIDYYTLHKDQLDEDSLRRLHTNPLRILDSKNPDMQAINQQAPKLRDSLDEQSFSTF